MHRSPTLQSILEAARKRFRARGGIPHEAFWEKVEAANAAPTGKQRRSQETGRAKD
jgi:hypothetical protein